MDIKPVIMIVDDSPSIVEMLEEILSGEGYGTLKAYDGLQALEILKGLSADLILTDLMMPKMDGLKLCGALKSDPRYRSIPVVLLTGNAEMEYKIKGIEAGADDFLIKPFDRRELLARVTSLLRVKELNVRVEKAYEGIASFIAYTDLSLRVFNQREDFGSDPFDGLADLFLRKSEREKEKPSHILMVFPAGSILYGFSGERYTKELMREDIGPIFHRESSQGADGLVWNPGEVFPEIQEPIGFLVSKVIERLRVVSNMVIACSDEFCVAAFNYPRKVNRMDLQLLKGLVIHNRFFMSLSNQVKEAENSFFYTIGALARAAEANDEDTGNHIARVNEYSRALSKEIGMSERFIEEIGYSAQMHDVGKVHVPIEILKKPGKLTAEEFERMKHHTVYGAKIVGDAPRLSMCRAIALTHHERYDGSGYPYGLKGEDIPIEGRIVAVADVYDALRNQRSYKHPLSHEEAVSVMEEGDEKGHFDPVVLEAFRSAGGRFKEIYERWRG